ncbi:hypothetical protein [Kaarinaea lacus]
MKKIGRLASGMFILGYVATVSAGDLTEYKLLAEDTIKQAQNGQIQNIDQLIAQQAKLVQIGVDACNDYADKNPKAKQILSLVTSNADTMKTLTLSEIEEQWHHGGELKKNGYEVKEDHFGQVGNLIDAVIHPATTYIALNKYKTDGNKAHLEQVVAELSEVLVHLNYLEE